MIEVRNIRKSYGRNIAVKDISFTAESGKIYGFLGPNGAGKSTTMNIITGCIAADSGTVLIDGKDIYENGASLRSKIGFLPEIPPLYTDMTPLEYLSFIAEAKGLYGADRDSAVSEAMELTSIAHVSGRLIANLSKGYRQRVGIAQALIGDPQIILLDEPMVGLDPKQITEMRELISSLKNDHTVIISSHILSEIREICDSLIIISEGKLAACGTLEEISKNHIDCNSLRLTVKADTGRMRMLLNDIPEIRKYTIDTDNEPYLTVNIEYDLGTDIAEKLFFKMSEEKFPITEMTHTTSSLEDVFLRLTAKKEEKPAVRASESGESKPQSGPSAPQEPKDTAEKSGNDDDYKPLFS